MMGTTWFRTAVVVCVSVLAAQGVSSGQDAPLPPGVKAVWDIDKAHRETTTTRERICINGLWRWQPARNVTDTVPTGNWGYCKTPGPWPGVTSWIQYDCQVLYRHRSWRNENMRNVNAAWYQRKITIPQAWAGRRITLYTEYLNSYAAVYLDGAKVGEMLFPWGEVDLTSACRPGRTHVLSLYTTAMPLSAVVSAYTDTGAPKLVKGKVDRRGLCGDVFLVSAPAGTRIGDVKVDTSVRKWEITFDTAVTDLDPRGRCTLRARILDGGRKVRDFTSRPFTARDLKAARFAFTAKWKPDKLWDVHTPGNTHRLQLSLMDAAGKVLDTYRTVRFGFREFWIDGRDFQLNGTRFHCFLVPLDGALVGAAWATYDGARETMLRAQSFGVNTVYTHNYGCQPGSHLGFGEILRAADDVGMLIVMSQPHYGHYKWDARDADTTNGYARHAEFYVRMAQNHPSVVMYNMNHNALGYSGSSNPDRIDGRHNAEGRVGPRTDRGAKRGERTEAIVRRLDPTRIVYHHSSGNLGAMHTNNLYLDFVPARERSDWFEHWATRGVKPLLLCEYGTPYGINWTLYRGWYKGKRSWGSAKIPWQFCVAEWNAQFLGDRAYRLAEMDKANLRFEAAQHRAGKEFHRWDYPFSVVSCRARGDDDKQQVWAMYISENWPAFRTWGLSAFNVWSYSNFWKPREGVNKARKNLTVDWNNLQRPGFSPDYIERRFERMDMAYERSDWIPTVAGRALLRCNRPLLAAIVGGPARFTTKDHNYHPGETVEKQIVVINDSRETVTCDCSWSAALGRTVKGDTRVTVETGQQARVPVRLPLRRDLKPGTYPLSMKAVFSTGETQEDTFTLHVLPRVKPAPPAARIALYDPKGETAKMLTALGVRFSAIETDTDLTAYDVLVVGKKALTVDGPAPDIRRVADGLKVVIFEQDSQTLEKRLGFRVQEYGLRRVFTRVPGHPVLSGLETANLCNWRGEATTVPPRLTRYEVRPRYGPTIEWCGIRVPRAWRCGCWGCVASVLIQKPARGDFLPIVDGGFSLQYSPLMEYREGTGMVLFCQMDVTGRTEADPAAERLAGNVLSYVSRWKPTARRKVVYAGDAAGKTHLERAGLSPAEYAGGDLTAGDVLVVGPGGGAATAARREAIARWLKDGGHLLAVGLDAREANTFLPFKVAMKRAEHIAAYFDAPPNGSPLAGVSPAEVHIREPRQLPLVSGGAAVVGDGVLAAADANVVFCQVTPWQFDHKKQYNLKIPFRRTSFLLTRLVGNMNVSGSTPLVSRFGRPPGTEKRYLDGFYLEHPVEYDDPYRYFLW